MSDELRAMRVDELRAMRAATPLEMAQAEQNAERTLDAWLHAFKQFPTENNRVGVVERLMLYQTAWMNGRERRDA